MDSVQAELKEIRGLPRSLVLDAYKLMFQAREIDETDLKLLRQGTPGHSFFIGSAGHECIGVAAAVNTRPGYDWYRLHYRDLAFALALGITAEDIFLGVLAREGDPFTGSRQLPRHWSSKRLHVVTESSPVGAQFLPSVGIAHAGRIYSLVEEINDREKFFQKDEVVVFTGGEAGISQGDFYESVNWACRMQLPVVIIVEDNEWGISVHRSIQTAGRDISKLLKGYEAERILKIFKVDGTDFFKSFKTMKEAVAHCRAGKGPSLVHADVVRLLGHSSADDHLKYRLPDDFERDKLRDPVLKLRQVLLEEEVFSEEELSALEEGLRREVEEAAERAKKAPFPDKKNATLHLFDSKVDPRDAPAPEPKFSGEKLPYMQMVNRALSDAMERDPRIVVFGEDVADALPDRIDKVPGKGGVFLVTHGLQKRFGSERVFNTPLAESSIAGIAAGLAQRGLKPVIEIQFADYIWPATTMIVSEILTTRYRSNNLYSASVVIRTTDGPGVRGAIWHSQTIEGVFSNFPGLHIVCPSDALSAYGLLTTAIRYCNDPVLVLEPKMLYREPKVASPYAGPDYSIPFGKASIKRAGDDVTLVTYGALLAKVLVAAEEAAKKGISVEVIDLLSILPWDKETVYNSIKKTGKVIVGHAGQMTGGFGGEMAATIQQELFDHLDAPVIRLAAKDCFIPFSPPLEEEILVQTREIVEKIEKLANY
ncbi:dehydrogenase E1 component subunit alpha/beta [candidate division TA06 bacterium]|nr:dehydrogenase E1 component subunit alpha/beta [candidate division TA06 bacterium]